MNPPLTLHAWLRYDAVQRCLRATPDVHSVLEVGAGLGSLGVRLAKRYDYLGLEPDPESYAVARRRFAAAGVREIRNCVTGDLTGDERFDLICAFEVLEHLEDDIGSLLEWRRFLEPGAFVLVSVPGWRARWGWNDIKAGHYRRYDPDDLRSLLAEAGFVGTRLIAYGAPLGYALESARALIARREQTQATLSERTAASGRWLQPPDWAGPLTASAAAPFRLLQRAFRRGTGLVALAHT